ncbi:SRPBCC family protein [Microbacterium sp. NPDC058389]|uniref:SRPBCC family protein n=1 Tax=Microbacterium sp. NPDC058389 TaxID=3346475 RepID=UPI00364DD4D1
MAGQTPSAAGLSRSLVIGESARRLAAVVEAPAGVHDDPPVVVRRQDGMVPSTFTLVTEAPINAEVLFDLCLDIDAHVASMAQSGESAVAGVVKGRIGLDETVTWRARHFGIWWTMTSQITALDRPTRFVDKQVHGPFKTFVHEHQFEQLATGSRITDTVTIASPVFGMLAERLVLVPYLRRLIAKRNTHLLTTLS